MSDLRALFLELESKVQHLSSRLEVSHLVLTSLPEGILYLTPKGEISLINPAMESLLKVKKERVVETPFWNHFEDSLFGFSMSGALESESQHRVLLSLDEREVEVTASFSDGLIVLIRDRTEMTQLEKSVQRNDRLKELGEMAATLAHEIRNPLGGIEGFASLLADDIQESSHQAMIAHIIEGTRTLNSLVSNILEYTREVRLHFRECDLVDLVKKSAALSAGTCTINAPPSLKISADGERLQLALLNIIRNGLEAAGEVKIIVKKGAIVEIRDEGPGMCEDVKKKIFTPFFTTKTKGTGLGLVEAQKVITAHGGTIEVESEEGKGTTFRVKL
ncbi:MAG: PAS domain-containing sensor histidine kinase [Chlamydiales bacterium]|nr:PAS domain-containing sensor histidine kinase [Chlamydiales bacterium]